MLEMGNIVTGEKCCYICRAGWTEPGENLHTSENRDWNTPRRISNSYRNITEELSSGEDRRERGRVCGTVMN